MILDKCKFENSFHILSLTWVTGTKLAYVVVDLMKAIQMCNYNISVFNKNEFSTYQNFFSQTVQLLLLFKYDEHVKMKQAFV